MPVIVSQNFDVAGGIVNGSIGTLNKIRYCTDHHTGDRKLLSCVVRIEGSDAIQMPHLEPFQFPVLEDTVDMNFTHPDTKRHVTIKRCQVPIEPAFALTAHKAQGQTFHHVVLDLESCKGTESPYVMLSRARSLDGVLILRPFDKKKIKCHQSEDAQKEFSRLRRLHLCTHIRSNAPDDSKQARAALRLEFGLVNVPDDLTTNGDRVLGSIGSDVYDTLERVQVDVSSVKRRPATGDSMDVRQPKRPRTH